VLPDRRLVQEALARAGVEIDPAVVPRAHYDAVRALDGDHVPRGRDPWAAALCAALGAPCGDAVASLQAMADRRRSGRVLWSEPTPGAVEAIVALRQAGFAVVIVTNSDGHAAENLRDAGLLAATGLDESAVIDSVVVGSAKPDTGIFEAALERSGVPASDALHVGDMLSTDIRGASDAGITPVHLDPYRRCRSRTHRHVRSMAGIFRHVRSR
jgi:HAD superfamily hydrolase (TIGR01509 family)